MNVNKYTYSGDENGASFEHERPTQTDNSINTISITILIITIFMVMILKG